MNKTDPKIIVALDFATAEQALQLVDQLSPQSCRLKVGKELFTTAGPALVASLVERGFEVFLDLKFHDIPNTVHKAVSAACELGVWMVNVHALGGRKMLQAAREAVDNYPAEKRPLLIAVSVLTSTDAEGLRELGIDKTIEQTVVDLTRMALDSGLDGMVCSALEAPMLREQFGQRPLLVTPGIRPAGASSDDQHRIMTPQKAISQGSSYLVIGRPITQHANPAQALVEINDSLAP